MLLNYLLLVFILIEHLKRKNVLEFKYKKYSFQNLQHHIFTIYYENTKIHAYGSAQKGSYSRN